MENQARIPVHVSIIMDGNGRWASQRGKERVQGHIEGTERVPEITAECARLGVKYVSFYTFSEENWNRPKEEVEFLMKLMWKSLHDKLEEMMNQGVKFLILGNRERLNPMLRSYIEDVEKVTATNSTITAILFLSYSGKWDILQAAKSLAREAASDPGVLSRLDSMTQDDFSRYLVTRDVPDSRPHHPHLRREEDKQPTSYGRVHIRSSTSPTPSRPRTSTRRTSGRPSPSMAPGTEDMGKSNNCLTLQDNSNLAG